MCCVDHRDILLLFFIFVTVSFEHHPDVPDDKNTDDEDEQKVSARKERAPAQEQDDKWHSTADKHHPHHSRVSFSVMVVHSDSLVDYAEHPPPPLPCGGLVTCEEMFAKPEPLE